MAPKLMALVAFSVIIGAAAWSCGDDSDPDVTITAEDTMFSPKTITIKSGDEVTLELQNNDTVEHDFQVDGLEIDVIAGGMGMAEHGGGGHGGGMLAMHTAGHESMSITFMTNEPGTYEFYCTIPGHKDSGMVGTLTVQ